MKTPEDLVQFAQKVTTDAMNAFWSHDLLACDVIAEALAQIQRETAQECAEIVDDADIHCRGGYERQDDGRATLRGARNEIRQKFGIEVCPLCGKPKGSAEGCCGCGA